MQGIKQEDSFIPIKPKILNHPALVEPAPNSFVLGKFARYGKIGFFNLLFLIIKLGFVEAVGLTILVYILIAFFPFVVIYTKFFY